MAENNTNMKFIILGLVLIVVGVIGYTSLQTHQALEASEAAKQNSTEEPESDPFLKAALKDRILGDPSAPVKISEHSSLTCSHCASFHKNTFEEFKKEYIDTGKVYLVFSDFPLNGPAVHASMIARCVPQDQYFDYIQSLFVNQENWAFDGNYINYLQTSAAEYGLNTADFKSCLNNEALQKGILEKLKAAQAQWKVSSTPTFVINNREVVSGAKSFAEFSSIIDEEIERVSQGKKESDEATSTEDLNLNE